MTELTELTDLTELTGLTWLNELTESTAQTSDPFDAAPAKSIFVSKIVIFSFYSFLTQNMIPYMIEH